MGTPGFILNRSVQYLLRGLPPSTDLAYDLQEAGWATATIRSPEGEVEVTASYLNDPVLELAEAALRLCHGTPGVTVVFMDEPGEHHLVLRQGDAGELSFEVRWFDDWASRGMHPPDHCEIILQGQTSVRGFRHQVLTVLWELDETFGPERYRERWVESAFPMEAYARLQAV